MTDKELGTAAGEIFAKAFTLGYETGREYVPVGGRVLTAELVEDVEALVATANPYSAPAARLRALFPATEPAEDAKPCGSNSVTLGWCKLTARHEGLHTNGTYLWGTPSEPDPPAPAEPAEEETKAETADAMQRRFIAEIRSMNPDAVMSKRLDELEAELSASSPVVPAPTETGPWQNVDAIQVGVPFEDKEGSQLVKLADGKFGYLSYPRETPETLAKYAPFVAAAEEG